MHKLWQGFWGLLMIVSPMALGAVADTLQYTDVSWGWFWGWSAVWLGVFVVSIHMLDGFDFDGRYK